MTIGDNSSGPQLNTFSRGDRVHHPRLGDGKILEFKGDKFLIQFDAALKPDTIYPFQLTRLEDMEAVAVGD